MNSVKCIFHREITTSDGRVALRRCVQLSRVPVAGDFVLSDDGNYIVEAEEVVRVTLVPVASGVAAVVELHHFPANLDIRTFFVEDEFWGCDCACSCDDEIDFAGSSGWSEANRYSLWDAKASRYDEPLMVLLNNGPFPGL